MILEKTPIPQELLDKVIKKADEQSYYSKGVKLISPKKLRNIISYLKSPKDNVCRLHRTEQGRILKSLQGCGAITFLSVKYVKLNVKIKK